jgi:hypothetical protein
MGREGTHEENEIIDELRRMLFEELDDIEIQVELSRVEIFEVEEDDDGLNDFNLSHVSSI